MEVRIPAETMAHFHGMPTWYRPAFSSAGGTAGRASGELAVEAFEEEGRPGGEEGQLLEGAAGSGNEAEVACEEEGEELEEEVELPAAVGLSGGQPWWDAPWIADPESYERGISATCEEAAAAAIMAVAAAVQALYRRTSRPSVGGGTVEQPKAEQEMAPGSTEDGVTEQEEKKEEEEEVYGGSLGGLPLRSACERILSSLDAMAPLIAAAQSSTIEMPGSAGGAGSRGGAARVSIGSGGGVARSARGTGSRGGALRLTSSEGRLSTLSAACVPQAESFNAKEDKGEEEEEQHEAEEDQPLSQGETGVQQQEEDEREAIAAHQGELEAAQQEDLEVVTINQLQGLKNEILQGLRQTLSDVLPQLFFSPAARGRRKGRAEEWEEDLLCTFFSLHSNTLLSTLFQL
jgi:hypothetical protein